MGFMAGIKLPRLFLKGFLSQKCCTVVGSVALSTGVPGTYREHKRWKELTSPQTGSPYGIFAFE